MRKNLDPRKNKLTLLSALVLTFATASGCGKVYNSSTFDGSTYGGASSGSTQFLAAKTVINNNCSTCHTRQSHEAWAGMSEAEFIAKGLITAGSLEASPLYTKILGNRTSTPGNMPQGGSALSDADLTTLELWIQGIQ